MCSFISYNLTCSLCVGKHIYVHIIFVIVHSQYVFALRRKALCNVSVVSLSEVRSNAEWSSSPAGV